MLFRGEDWGKDLGEFLLINPSARVLYGDANVNSLIEVERRCVFRNGLVLRRNGCRAAVIHGLPCIGGSILQHLLILIE